MRDLRNLMKGVRQSVDRELAKRQIQMDYPEGQITTLNLIEGWMDDFGFTANT